MKSFISFDILKKISLKKKKLIKTYSRSSFICNFMLNKLFGVYNGKKFIPVFINEKMFNYKLGSFALTRTFRKHKVKDKKIIRNTKKKK